MTTTCPKRLDRRNVADRGSPPGSGLARRLAWSLAGPVARNGLLSVLDQGVVSGTNFVTSVVIGRLCSQEELGVYALALSVVMVLRGVQENLVCAPYMIYCNRRQGPALAAYTGSTLMHHVFLSALGVACLLGLAVLLSLGVGPAGRAPIAWVLVGAAPFLLLRNHVRQLMFSHHRPTTGFAIDAGVAVLQLGGLLLLWHLRLLTVAAVFAVTGGACAVVCLGWFLARTQPLRFEPRQFAADWRENWAFARWTLASFLIGSPAAYLVPWAMAFAHGEAATGLLAACQTVVNLASTYAAGVANFLAPAAAKAFARGGLPALRRVLGGTAVLYAVTLGAFFLGIGLTGDLFATLIYGGRYAGTGPVLAVLALSLLVNSLGVVAGNGLWALDRPRANFAADACTLGVTGSVLLCLVGPLGVLGAAVALLAGSITGVTVRCLTLLRLMARLRAASPEQGPPQRGTA